MISRSWQSMTAARWPQPSRPQEMWVRSIAQRSLLAGPADQPWTRGRGVCALVDEPALELQDAVDGLAVDDEAVGGAAAPRAGGSRRSGGAGSASRSAPPAPVGARRSGRCLGRRVSRERAPPAPCTCAVASLPARAVLHSSDVLPGKGRPLFASFMMSMSKTSCPPCASAS